MPLFAELPVEVLLDNLFLFLSARDLGQLAATSKFFSVLTADDTVWKRKLEREFNFTGDGTARTSGWKTIYRGLWRPKVFVWGEKANGRLGVANYPRSSVTGVPFPFELKIPNARIVSLAAGGMSFHALDSEGNVHVWGTLHGNSGVYSSTGGFSASGTMASTPLRLQLPSPVRSISCGRVHSSILDKQNRVWTFVNWGRPFTFTTHTLNNPLSVPIQVECGWMHSALLTATGEVFVWWPFNGTLADAIREKEAELDPQQETKATPVNGVIPCTTWSTSIEPKRLPGLPPLPELKATGKDRQDELPHLIQIAGLDKIIIGLTNEGHVLKFDSLDDEESVSRGRWEYLPKFSDLNFIRQNKAFAGEADGGKKLEAPTTLQITHVSANFQTFIAYSTASSSMVLIGKDSANRDSDPEIKPELQNRSVISVVVGDWHNAALTSDGKLLTWGQFSSGALGLGDPAKLEPGQPGGFGRTAGFRGSPAAVDNPAEVRFDYGCKSPRNRFCFAVTAGGWHTGALVLDLEPDGEQEDVYEMEGDDRDINSRQFDPSTYESPPIVPTGGIFRIGHAGRGRGLFGRGRGSGHGNNDPEPLL